MFKVATWNFQPILTLDVLITAALTVDIASGKGYHLSITIPVGRCTNPWATDGSTVLQSSGHFKMWDISSG